MFSRFLKWRVVKVVPGLDIRPKVKQHLDYRRLGGTCSVMQRGVAKVVPGLDVGAVLKEDNGNIQPVARNRGMQRGVAVVVPGFDVGSSFQQHADDGPIRSVARHQVQRSSSERVSLPDTYAGQYSANVIRIRVLPELR